FPEAPEIALTSGLSRSGRGTGSLRFLSWRPSSNGAVQAAVLYILANRNSMFWQTCQMGVQRVLAKPGWERHKAIRIGKDRLHEEIFAAVLHLVEQPDAEYAIPHLAPWQA